MLLMLFLFTVFRFLEEDEEDMLEVLLDDFCFDFLFFFFVPLLLDVLWMVAFVASICCPNPDMAFAIFKTLPKVPGSQLVPDSFF